MTLNALIYTTSKTDWFSPDFKFIRETVAQAKGIELASIAVEQITLPQSVPSYQDPDGDVKPDWEWFEQQFAVPARARGFNVVCWHLTKAEQRKLGLTGYNGFYLDDPDDVMEFMIVCGKGQEAKAYPYSEFTRLFLHEMGHGIERWLYGKSSILVHTYDYQNVALHEVYREFDAGGWNVRKAFVGALAAVRDIFANLTGRQQSALCQVAEVAIGTDASPDDRAPDELGCAETVSCLIQAVLPDFPIITGTWTLWDTLAHDRRFEKVLDTPRCGDIIISPTVPGKPFPGHAGIFADHWNILSNDSRSGMFERNYTMEGWRDRYADRGGYPIYIYRIKH